jgi:hypothetical protein
LFFFFQYWSCIFFQYLLGYLSRYLPLFGGEHVEFSQKSFKFVPHTFIWIFILFLFLFKIHQFSQYLPRNLRFFALHRCWICLLTHLNFELLNILLQFLNFLIFINTLQWWFTIVLKIVIISLIHVSIILIVIIWLIVIHIIIF